MPRLHVVVLEFQSYQALREPFQVLGKRFKDVGIGSQIDRDQAQVPESGLGIELLKDPRQMILLRYFDLN